MRYLVSNKISCGILLFLRVHLAVFYYWRHYLAVSPILETHLAVFSFQVSYLAVVCGHLAVVCGYLAVVCAVLRYFAMVLLEVRVILVEGHHWDGLCRLVGTYLLSKVRHLLDLFEVKPLNVESELAAKLAVHSLVIACVFLVARELVVGLISAAL